MLNPFMPGAGMRPPELVGRDSDIQAIQTLCYRTHNDFIDRGIVFSGLRGVGKTVLLMTLRDIVVGENMVAAKMEATGDEQDDYERLMYQIQLAVLQADNAFADTLADIRSRIEQVNVSLLGTSVQLNTRPQQTGQALEFELTVTTLCQRLKQRHQGLFLFIDELQEMAPAVLASLISVQHAMGQQDLPFYIIGAGLPNLPGTLSKSRSYAERLFEYRTIGQLGTTDTMLAFTKPAQEMGRTFSRQAIEELTRVSQGYPYFIQAYGKAAWDESQDKTIQVEQVQRSEKDAQQELDRGLYESRWQRATTLGRVYMQTMARIAGDAPVATSRVAQALKKSQQELTQIRASLIKLGLIYSPVRGQVAFTIPAMGEYVLRTELGDEVVYA